MELSASKVKFDFILNFKPRHDAEAHHIHSQRQLSASLDQA